MSTNSRVVASVVGTIFFAALLGGCQSKQPPSPHDGGLHRSAVGDQYFFTGGIETDRGYYEYLAHVTGLTLGRPSAAEMGQTPKAMYMMMRQPTSTAPSTDLPWIIIPDGWIYIVGDMPCVATGAAEACSDGSTIVVQRFVMRDQTLCDRFIMLRTHLKTSGHVTGRKTRVEKPFKGKGASWIDVAIDSGEVFDATSFDDDPQGPANQQPPADISDLLKEIRAARKKNHVP